MKNIISILKYIQDLYRGDQIFIYQMGKVGSSTLEKSISDLGIDVKHVHSFGNTNNYNFQDIGKTKSIKLKIWKYIYRLIFKFRRKKIKIITLMREPVSRNISTLFQEISYMLYLHDKNNNRQEQEIQSILQNFMNKYIDSDIPLKWFDKELKYFMGIDIFKYPFNKEKGAIYINEGKIEVLVLTAEKLTSNENIIKKFINKDYFKLLNTNVSNNKWYSEINKEFKKNYKISKKKCEYFYDSKIVSYFYSEEDKQKFKKKWCDYRS